MSGPEPAEQVQRLAAALADFHEAVKRAHRRAAERTLEQTLRQLAWLDEVAHSVAMEAWEGKLAALRDTLDGLPGAAGTLSPEALSTCRLHEAARSYWLGRLPEAAAPLLEGRTSRPEDLEGFVRAVGLFFEELARAAEGPPSGPVPPGKG